MTEKLDTFKKDGKTRRCRAWVYPPSSSNPMCGGSPGYQCTYEAHMDGALNKPAHCWIHSRSGIAERKMKRQTNEVAKARALLKANGIRVEE